MDAIREDRLGRAVTWSFVGHGAIALFIVLKSLVFPGEPVMIAPALRVDLVGLPDLLKKDLSSVPKILPKSETPAKPATKPVPSAEIAKPDEMVLHPKKTEKTKKKIDAALARIRALERLKDKTDDENADEEAIVIKGNQISKGASLSGDAREKAQFGYYDLVREALVEYWALPTYLTREKLSAQIQMRIDPAGRVLSLKFVKSSGNPKFDEAIRATIRDAQPLPRPPKELLGSLADDGIVVGFPL